jgi:hypothetical protein
VHCFTALEALREHAATSLGEDIDVSVAVCFDHEEVVLLKPYILSIFILPPHCTAQSWW